MEGNDSLKADSHASIESHKPPIITAHDADPPESPVEAHRAAHSHCLLLLLQKILAEKQLLCLFITSSFVRIFFEVLISSLQLFNLHTELLPAKKREVSTPVFIPYTNYPVYKYKLSNNPQETGLEASWLHSTQIAPILEYNEHVISWFDIEYKSWNSLFNTKTH